MKGVKFSLGRQDKDQEIMIGKTANHNLARPAVMIIGQD